MMALMAALWGVASSAWAVDSPAGSTGVSASASKTNRIKNEKPVSVERGAELRASPFLAAQHNDKSLISPLSSPLLEAPKGEFIPGQTGVEDLFGLNSLAIVGARGGGELLGAKVVDRLNLASAATLALDFSRDVKGAMARLDQADAQSGQALGNLLPNLSLRYAAGNESSSPSSVTDPKDKTKAVPHSTHHRSDYTLTLRQPIVDVSLLSEWRRRNVLTESRRKLLTGTKGDEYVSLVQAYLTLTSARLQAALAKEYELQLEGLLDYITQRSNAGAASESDAQRVKARVLTARATSMEQEAAQEAALVDFIRLTNAIPRELQLPRFSDLQLTLPANVEAAVAVGLDKNPEVQSLLSDLEAAGLDRNVALGKFMPQVNLELTDNLTHGAGGVHDNPALSLYANQHDVRAMFVLSWSLLAGGSDYHLVKEKLARKEEAYWNLDSQRRKLIQGLSAQYATLESSRSRLATGYKELTAITQAARAMSERMLAGNTSLLDLMDVLERVYQNRQRLVVLHTQEVSAGVQIGRLLGQPEKLISESGNAGASVADEPALGQGQ